MDEIKKKKSLKVLGMNEEDIPEEYAQVLLPMELKDGDLNSMNFRELFHVHLGSDPNMESHVTSTSFLDAASSMTTTRTLLDVPGDERKGDDQLAECSGDLFNFVFDIKHCIFKAGNDTKMLFSIFDDTDKRMVTEEYCLHLSANNFPTVGSPEGLFTRCIAMGYSEKD